MLVVLRKGKLSETKKKVVWELVVAGDKEDVDDVMDFIRKKEGREEVAKN